MTLLESAQLRRIASAAILFDGTARIEPTGSGRVTIADMRQPDPSNPFCCDICGYEPCRCQDTKTDFAARVANWKRIYRAGQQYYRRGIICRTERDEMCTEALRGALAAYACMIACRPNTKS